MRTVAIELFEQRSSPFARERRRQVIEQAPAVIGQRGRAERLKGHPGPRWSGWAFVRYADSEAVRVAEEHFDIALDQCFQADNYRSCSHICPHLHVVLNRH